ncbi:MAG: PaaI family thioesterase [Spirochaetota bacterium]
MDVHEEISNALQEKLAEYMASSANAKNLEVPPKIFQEMQGRFVSYMTNESLQISFPVKETYANPMQTMQGGMIATAFDCAFGALSYLLVARPSATLGLNTNYIRPIPIGDTILVEAKLVVRGFHTMNLSGECYNSKKKLLATATSHVLLINT